MNSVDIHGDDGYSQIALFGSRFDGVERLGVLRIRGQIRASEVSAPAAQAPRPVGIQLNSCELLITTAGNRGKAVE